MNSNDEIPKRLAPSTETLRKLYSLSGNLCAYPGCNQLMIDENQNFVGKVCHIEAAMPGGQRFNPEMSNEDRRQYENLLLMCEQHHIETDKVNDYPVQKMKQIKGDHERKYSQDIIEQKILNSLRDYTKLNNNFIKPKTLEKFFDVLSPEDNGKYRRDIQTIEEDVDAFNDTMSRFLTLTPSSRKIFLFAIDHSHHPIRCNREDEETLYVDQEEIARAMGKTWQEIESNMREIEAKKLMHIGEVELMNDLLVQRHIISSVTPNNLSGEYIWLNLRNYCKLTKQDFVDFIEKLDFSSLD